MALCFVDFSAALESLMGEASFVLLSSHEKLLIGTCIRVHVLTVEHVWSAGDELHV